jgi:hypothetical protein
MRKKFLRASMTKHRFTCNISWSMWFYSNSTTSSSSDSNTSVAKIPSLLCRYGNKYSFPKRWSLKLQATGNEFWTSQCDNFILILPLGSLYIFLILLFFIKNKKLITNYDSHNIETRQCVNLHFPNTRLTLYQNGVYFTGIKIFNKLPS